MTTIATKRSRARFSISKISITFLLRFIIAVLCLVLILFSLVYSAKTLRDQYRLKYTTETTVMLSSAALDVSVEPWLIYSNASATDAYMDVDRSIQKLRSRTDLFGVSIDEIAQLIEHGRTYAQQKLYTQAIDAYSNANLLLMSSLRVANTQQLDNIAAVQIGVICLLLQVTPIFTHYSLILPYFINRFTTPIYETYVANSFTTLINPNCSAYCDKLDPTSLYAILKSGPTLAAQPKIWLSNTSAVLNSSSFLQSMRWYQNSIQYNGNYTVGCWQSRIKYYTSAVVLLAVASVIICSTIIVVPFLMTKRKTKYGPTAQQKYKRIESQIKLVTQHAQSLMTLKSDNKWQAFVRDTFLYKINAFIARARPCIPQTCFGDVEVMTTRSVQRGDDALMWDDGNDMTAIDENGLQDLRFGVGLRPVYGTFMCISAQINDSEDFEKGSKLGSLAQRFCTSMSNLVSHVESVASAHRGSVHTVTGDMIIVTWNVVSTCRTSEVNALHTALDIIYATHMRRPYSIGISNGAVLAGTVEDGQQRHPIICGPAIRRCQRLLMVNALQVTTLILDESVAARLSSSSVPGYTYTIVPVSMYGFRTDVAGPRSVYAVCSIHMNDYFREWSASFSDFRAMMVRGSYSRLLAQLEQYLNDAPLKTKQQEKHQSQQLSLLSMDVNKIVGFWIATVKSLIQEASTSNAIEQKNKRPF